VPPTSWRRAMTTSSFGWMRMTEGSFMGMRETGRARSVLARASARPRAVANPRVRVMARSSRRTTMVRHLSSALMQRKREVRMHALRFAAPVRTHLFAAAPGALALRRRPSASPRRRHQPRHRRPARAPGHDRDPGLVNAWGIAYSPTSPFWVSANGN
jgi:hypothetical protein